MSLPLVTAVAPRWEAALAASLTTSRQVHVARRCADVAELLGVVAAGTGRVVLVSTDLRGVDRSVADALRQHGVAVLGVHPPGDEAAARLLRRWGLSAVLPADAGADDLDAALDQLLGDAGTTSETSGRLGASWEGTAGARERQQGGATAGAPLVDGTPEDGHLAARGVTDGATAYPHDDGTAEERAPGALDAAVPGDVSVPADPAEVADEGLPEEEEGPGQVVVVWGPIGSTGRTTVAVNLAAELADPLSPVVLVDADTYGASAAQTLAVLDEVPGIAAAARAADQGTLDRATLARLAPEVRPGLRILTGLPRADRWPEIRDVALADVLDECRRLARWTVVDVAAPLEQDEELSFDTMAPRRNGAALTALDAADRVVVVGTGDPVGLQRLVRGLDLLSGCTHAERTVVVTRVRPGPVGPDPGRRIQEALDRFASAGRVHLVPEDQDALDAALLHGRALLEVRPRSAARLAVADLADVVADSAPASRRERVRARRRWLTGRRVASA